MQEQGTYFLKQGLDGFIYSEYEEVNYALMATTNDHVTLAASTTDKVPNTMLILIQIISLS